MTQDPHQTSSYQTTSPLTQTKRTKRWLVKAIAFPMIPLLYVIDLLLESLYEAERLQNTLRERASRSRSGKGSSWGTHSGSTRRS